MAYYVYTLPKPSTRTKPSAGVSAPRRPPASKKSQEQVRRAVAEESRRALDTGME